MLSSRSPALAAFAALLWAPSVVTAAAGDDWTLEEHRPATWDDDEAQLRDAGLGQSRGAPVVPARPLAIEPESTGDLSGPTVLFLNFEGALLESGPDDSRSNLTTIADMAGPYPAYGTGGSKRAAVVQSVREDWSAYDAVIATQRPHDGDYVMAMVGPGNPDDDSKLGIAVLDCGDARTRNNVVFAFHRASDSHTAASTATTISQEVAHSLGLEHVSEPSDIMNPTNVGGDPSFRDECLAITGEQVACPAQHEAECGAPDLQNAHQELYRRIGPATPDASGPSVQLVAPMDGENFEIDEEFEIIVEADEEITVAKAALFVNTVLQNTDDAAPFGWTARQPATGEYELRVEVLDAAGFIRVSNTVTITVGRTSSAGAGGALPPSGYSGRGEPQSCACRSGSGSGRLPLWTVLIVASLRRRRRVLGPMANSG